MQLILLCAPHRHGAAAFLAITMCTSLFVVYNVSSNDAGSSNNASAQKTANPTKVSSKTQKAPSPLQGYISIIDHSRTVVRIMVRCDDIKRKAGTVTPIPLCPALALPLPRPHPSLCPPQPLKMHCSSCSLVTSSGHLTGGGRGADIDRAECVIRMNDAPAASSFGADVGRRTSLRVVAHSSMQRVLRARRQLLDASQDAVFVFWGPSSYMRRDGKGLVYNNLRLVSQVLPKLKVYIISWQKMLQFDELFKRETGKDSLS
ncbi:hypothetical protein P4O66_003003 [Electrophorus voltai]|uniref:Alpha-N-acetylgalactosaminide alpha-2,6-sialyltransferase 5 n=1 Tax=Electrophorus voltai TaxID=2609070 RepID=A0AAD8YSH0_9TELE|nr:hypothetical protein P4O66_003003 [Electrophorus voltai]